MRRFTHIFLILAFCCMAAGQSYSQTIDAGSYTGAAFLGKVSGGSIKLNGNVTLTSMASITSALTIDLNGYALTGNIGEEALLSTNGGSLTIINSYTGTPRTHTITLYNGSNISVSGAVISNRSSRGIVARNACSISNCKIVGCYRASGSGGAINVYTNGSLTMTNVEVSYNYAGDSGGGIQGRRLNFTNCTITKNMVGGTSGTDQYKGRGGGLYIVDSDVTCTFSGCTISYNYAPREGGGIFSIGSTTINNSVIEYNYAMPISNNSAHNQAWGRGGGFYLGREKTGRGVATYTLSGTIVRYNAAKQFGGGGQIGMISNDDFSTLNINNSHIANNETILQGAGGLHVTGEAILNFNSGSISNNVARRMGGGIHSSRTCTLNLNGGEITGNTVYGRGGAINLSVGSDVVLNGTDILNNTAYTGYNYNATTITYDSANFRCSWTAPTYSDSTPIQAYGGGVAVDSGSCTIKNNSEVSGNSAQYDGGGVALVLIDVQTGAKVPSLTMANGTISNNSSNGNGGGVYIMMNTSSLSGNISATVNGGSVSGNKSAKNGGAIYLDNGGQFTMADGVTMSGNKAGNGGSGSGGAVYVSQGTAIINGGNISANSASVSGGAIYVNGNVTVSKGNLTGNSATSHGGAIYVQTGTVSLNNIVMSGNTASSNGGALYLGSGSLGLGSASGNSINNNKAANGAGVCIANGTLSISNCSITDNTATQNGGGLYVANQSAVTINLTGGGVFKNNTASAGGGMAVGGAITLNFEGSIQNNTASNGGGIYLFKGSASTGATLNFKDGFIRNNYANGNSGSSGYQASVSAIGGFGGGVFLDQGSTFKTTLASGATFGFYGNKAVVGGDDIFANGNGTTVNLPDIEGMKLSDFGAPTPELFWVEDYVNGDTYYTSGTRIITTAGYSALRYQKALETGSPNIGKLLPANYSTYSNKYLCLALGWQLFYVTLQKKGLESGDIALMDISYNDNGTNVVYRKVKFVGKGADKAVVTVVALPPGTWIFTEDARWSWRYDVPAPLTKEIKTSAQASEVIVFTNTLKDSSSGVDIDVHHETYKENRMRTQ